MRILVVALAAAALLAGCSSPSDLMSSPANLTVTTSKSAKAYALCVFPEWQEHSTAAVMSETAKGYRIVNGFGQQTDDVLDITSAQAGAVGKLYQRVAWSQLGRSSLRDSMQKCR
jgi:outer membrane biogenesis lipoprotein LolB